MNLVASFSSILPREAERMQEAFWVLIPVISSATDTTATIDNPIQQISRIQQITRIQQINYTAVLLINLRPLRFRGGLLGLYTRDYFGFTFTMCCTLYYIRRYRDTFCNLQLSATKLIGQDQFFTFSATKLIG